MNLTLKVWRQDNATAAGRFENYSLTGISDHMSFLEMLDTMNEKLIDEGHEPIAFDSDCREGICGTCGLMINGQPHGPQKGTATCQLHMRKFVDGDEITIEPWRAAAFPVMKDLIVDRSPLDAIIEAGGYRMVSDRGAIAEAVEAALAANPKAIEDLQGGKKKPEAVKGFLRGQVMKQTGGKADPALVGEILDAKLAELAG